MFVSRILTYLCLSAAALALGGCINEDIEKCPPAGDLKVMVDNHWTLAPGAAPEGMACFFFPSDGSAPWRFDIPGSIGGTVRIAEGAYSFITVNDDFSSVLLSGEDSYSTIEVTTMPADPLPVRSDAAEKVMMSPDMLWSYATPSVKLAAGGISYTFVHPQTGKTESVQLSCPILFTYPRQIVSTYAVVINNVANLDGVVRISGALTGLASGRMLADGSRPGEPVTVPFNLKSQGKDTITGSFYTFGLPDTGSSANILHLYFWLSDGQKLSYEIDVTRQVAEAPDPLDVQINLDGIELPPAKPGAGSFDVGVDGWKTIVINL